MVLIGKDKEEDESVYADKGRSTNVGKTPQSIPKRSLDAVVPTMPEITYEMNLVINRLWMQDSREEIFNRYRQSISEYDLTSLRGKNWLNDAIINLYAQMINRRRITDSSWPKVYSFNTYFFKSITCKEKDYNIVRRHTRNPMEWTDGRQFDLFNFELVFGKHF